MPPPTHFWPPPVHVLGIAGVHVVVEAHTVAGPELTEIPPLSVPQIGLSVHDVSYVHVSGAPVSATKHPEGADLKLQSPPSDAMDAAEAESITPSARTTMIARARTPTHANTINVIRAAFAPTRVRVVRLPARIVRRFVVSSFVVRARGAVCGTRRDQEIKKYLIRRTKYTYPTRTNALRPATLDALRRAPVDARPRARIERTNERTNERASERASACVETTNARRRYAWRRRHGTGRGRPTRPVWVLDFVTFKTRTSPRTHTHTMPTRVDGRQPLTAPPAARGRQSWRRYISGLGSARVRVDACVWTCATENDDDDG